MASKPAAKSGPSKIPAPKVVGVLVPQAAEPDSSAPEAAKAEALKLKALVDRVVQATGAKKKDARELVEATLNEVSAALLRGEELNLPGVGRVRVARSAEKDGRSTVVLKMRTGGAPKKKEAKEGLAEAEEAV